MRLRGNLCCGEVKAEPPSGVGTEKFDARVAEMVALLESQNGMPFYRRQAGQSGFGIPLPIATQGNLVDKASELSAPVIEELLRQGAAEEVLYNDDTTMTVRDPTSNASALDVDDAKSSEWTGSFTTWIVSEPGGRRSAIFVTGREHAEEIPRNLLAKRAGTPPRPIRRCNALSRNSPKAPIPILSGSSTHARRKVVDELTRFPEACHRVSEDPGSLYVVDAAAKERGLSPAERLALHQAETGPVGVEVVAVSMGGAGTGASRIPQDTKQNPGSWSRIRIPAERREPSTGSMTDRAGP